MLSSDFQFTIHRFNCLESTNSYALQQLHAKKVVNGDVIWSLEQLKGQGQRGENWQSDKGKNLLFSVVSGVNLRVEMQFYLSKAVALALYYFIDSLSVANVSIKWPNDLLVAGQKIAGILIQNSIQGSKIQHAVIGIGLNVNQTVFEKYKRKATSLKLIKGEEFDLEELLQQFLPFLSEQLVELQKGNFKKINQNYLNHLYGFQSLMQFKDEEGAFTGQIIGIAESGHLQVSKVGVVKDYDLKGLEFWD